MKAVIRNPEAFSLTVLSCIVTLLPVFASVGGLFLAMLAPFPLIVLGLKYPWRYVLGLLSVEAGFLLLLEGLPAFFLLNYYVVVPVVMLGAIRRGYAISPTITGSVIAPVMVSLILLGLASMIAQQSPRALLLHAFEQVLHAMQEQLQTLEPTQDGNGDRLMAATETVSKVFLMMLPAMLVMNHLLTNVVNYVLVRLYLQQSRTPIRLDPEDLACWRASDYLVWVFLASGAMLLLPLGILSTFGLNVFLITLMIYLLQGIAIAVFWGRRLPFPPRVRWLLAVLVFLLAGPLCAVVCTVMGLFDLWVDFRRQRRHPLTS